MFLWRSLEVSYSIRKGSYLIFSNIKDDEDEEEDEEGEKKEEIKLQDLGTRGRRGAVLENKTRVKNKQSFWIRSMRVF